LISSNHGWKVENLGWNTDMPPESMSKEFQQQQVEWNLVHIKADKLWAKGFRGRGWSVGNADTGIHWEHPALLPRYRGHRQNGQHDHNYNWWDGVRVRHFANVTRCQYSSPVPCDDNGHGTHTVGTSVGIAGARIIGVAPESTWTGCRVMEGGFARDLTIISCLEWFLAPKDLEGKNPKPELRPVAIGNSYGCNPIRCPNSEVQKDAVEALYAAGVFMVVSAGNSGPRCSSVDRAPTHYAKSLVIGATAFNATRLASFSSKGPVKVDNSNRRKPDLTAPGERVTSAVPPNGYSAMSGTSMSSPAVNGAIALLYSAVPSIARNMTCVQHILQRTAQHQADRSCDSPQDSPNNSFGFGTVDMEAAFEYARTNGCK
jgi:subtilisin family serine protease